MTPERLAELMRPRFVRDRQRVRVNHALPLGAPARLLLALGVVAAALRLARRRLVRPLEMRRLRYVARFRVPVLYGGTIVLAAGGAAAVAARLAAYAAERFAVTVLWRVDSAFVQWGAYALALAVGVWAVTATLARVPRKLLVFENALAVKYLAYRSTVIRADDVAELALLRFRDVWLSRRLWRCVPLALGVRGPGVYVRRTDGRGYYFGTRDTAEAFAVLADCVYGSGRVRLSHTPDAVPGAERGELVPRPGAHTGT
jgi:hypothetical protein